MTMYTLFEILDSWTHDWDSTVIEITLNQIANSFNNQKVRFLLIDRVWDVIGDIEDPLDYFTAGINMSQIEQLLQEEKFEQVAKFIQIEVSEPPEFKISVLNIKETISQFPNWFEEFKGVSWDEFTSRLFDQ